MTEWLYWHFRQQTSSSCPRTWPLCQYETASPLPSHFQEQTKKRHLDMDHQPSTPSSVPPNTHVDHASATRCTVCVAACNIPTKLLHNFIWNDTRNLSITNRSRSASCKITQLVSFNRRPKLDWSGHVKFGIHKELSCCTQPAWCCVAEYFAKLFKVTSINMTE